MAKTGPYKCTKCGDYHGGVSSTTLCPSCYEKANK
jgi:rubrerythrin